MILRKKSLKSMILRKKSLKSMILRKKSLKSMILRKKSLKTMILNKTFYPKDKTLLQTQTGGQQSKLTKRFLNTRERF